MDGSKRFSSKSTYLLSVQSVLAVETDTSVDIMLAHTRSRHKRTRM